MLEELGDKVVGQIKRQAVTSFRSALDEMLDFHRFLLDAHLTVDGHGRKDSWARMGDWRAVHQEWTGQYRRLFEEGALLIGQQDDFIEELMHVPYRLLPSDSRRADSDTTVQILNLIPTLVHRLENWFVANRRVVFDVGEAKVRSLRSDNIEKAYEETLRRLIGAWEQILDAAEYIYGWQRTDLAAVEQWNRYGQSWLFLQQHLHNSAYITAVASWNEDLFAVELYADSLKRWSANLIHSLPDGIYGVRPFLFPDLTSKNWGEIEASIDRLKLHPRLFEIEPSKAMRTVVEGAWRDALFVVCGVLIAWYVEKSISAEATLGVVLQMTKGTSDDDYPGSVPAITFKSAALSFFRMLYFGFGRERGSYGQVLDDLIRRLDELSERETIPGRVYSPSTRHRREDLRYPWLVYLLMLVPADSSDESRAFEELLDVEAIFGGNDTPTRIFISQVSAAKESISKLDDGYLERGLGALSPNTDFRDAAFQLASFFDGVIDRFQRRRTEAIARAPLDEIELEELRRSVERDLLQIDSEIQILDQTQVLVDAGDYHERVVRFSPVEKGYLTNPRFGERQSNFAEFIARQTRRRAVGFVWSDLMKRKRRVRSALKESTFRRVFLEEAEQKVKQGLRLVLLVTEGDIPPWVHKALASEQKDQPEGVIVRKRSASQPRFYLGTINEVDVYRTELEFGASFLLRSDILKAVKFTRGADGTVVRLEAIESDDQQQVSLVFHFAEEPEFNGDEVVELRHRPKAKRTRVQKATK
jgi:hypothetical protein